MQPRLARGRVALIDESGDGHEIGRALTNAGYEVRHSADGQVADGAVVVRVSSQRAPFESERSPRSPGDIAAHRPEDARQLGERQKMEAIARLAGGIAHDFNNLLAVISICTDEVIDAVQPNEHVRACLEDIRRAVERGSTVTRDLLAFSQRDIQAPRLVDLNEIVTASQRMIERIVGEDVQISAVLDAMDAYVRIDPSQWSSVFVNLALNARSAMPDGGSLLLRTRNVDLDSLEPAPHRPPGRYVEVEVTDTGCGMTDDVRARIFEPFFTTKPDSRSAGLGLAVVFGVVERSGGFIEVASEVGRGTSFRLYVPLAKEYPVTETRRRVLPEAGEGVVLVVEDEEAVRRIAVRALERSGYRVVQAASAEEALASVDEAEPIDLLVTDIVLPGMNGRQLADALLARRPALAVLYTSGYTSDEVVRSGVARCELSFLAKPYSSSDLVERASEVLASARARSIPA